MKQWIARWLRRLLTDVEVGLVVSKTRAQDIDTETTTTFTVIKAQNGKLVKVSSYRPTKGHGPDWHHELWIVQDNEKVVDVIGRALAINALENA